LCRAFENRHLVRLHQRAHTAVECLYNLVLALLHLREIGARPVDHDAVLHRLFFDEHEMIARGESALLGMQPTFKHVPPNSLSFSTRASSTQAGRSGWQQHNRPVRADDNNIKFFHGLFSIRT
jgi:hypothetical protein